MLSCAACGHEWQSSLRTPPKTCPRCKSYKWDSREGHVTIYALRDSSPAARIFYVGQSANPYGRFYDHKFQTKGKGLRAHIAALTEQGMTYHMTPLEVVPTEQGNEREDYWIQRLRDKGEPIVNVRPLAGTGPNGELERLGTLVIYVKSAERLAARLAAAKHDMSLSSWVGELIRRAVEEGAEGK